MAQPGPSVLAAGNFALPNPRLQRTRAALLLKSVPGERSSSGGYRRAPLSRQPLGRSQVSLRVIAAVLLAVASTLDAGAQRSGDAIGDQIFAAAPIGVTLLTADLHRSVEFYQDLGFTVVSYLKGSAEEVQMWDEKARPYWARLKAGENEIFLWQDVERKAGCRNTANRFDFHVTDVDQVFVLLTRRGLDTSRFVCADGKVLIFSVFDPDGNWIFFDPIRKN